MDIDYLHIRVFDSIKENQYIDCNLRLRCKCSLGLYFDCKCERVLKQYKDDVINNVCMCKAGTYGKAHEYNGLALAVLLHVANMENDLEMRLF
jgi:hypothetical protein